jgi:hypothetical protein
MRKAGRSLESTHRHGPQRIDAGRCTDSVIRRLAGRTAGNRRGSRRLVHRLRAIATILSGATWQTSDDVNR